MDVEYVPIRKIKIYEILHHPIDVLLSEVGDGGMLRWADGILFMNAMMPAIPDVIKDRMDGIVHWDWLMFSEYQQYIPMIDCTIYGKTRKIPVIDVSFNLSIVRVIKWIKQQPQWCLKPMET